MPIATCDICDANETLLESGELAALPPVFRSYGGVQQFSGPARTLKVFEDNGMVRATLETPGAGHVLVIDGGGSLRCALVGGNLALLAEKNGWAGIIVHGCVRDALELSEAQTGIFALGTMPVRSIRRGSGVADLKLVVAGVSVHPGDWIYADEDGVLVARKALH
jgi:regulator of ribonuclease activity A